MMTVSFIILLLFCLPWLLIGFVYPWQVLAVYVWKHPEQKRLSFLALPYRAIAHFTRSRLGKVLRRTYWESPIMSFAEMAVSGSWCYLWVSCCFQIRYRDMVFPLVKGWERFYRRL